MTNHKRKYIWFVLSWCNWKQNWKCFCFVFYGVSCLCICYWFNVQSLFVYNLYHIEVSHNICLKLMNYTEDVKWWTATDQTTVHWGDMGKELRVSSLFSLFLFVVFVLFFPKLYLLSWCKMNYKSGLRPGFHMEKKFPLC